MPPRKSNVSVGSNGAEEGGEGAPSKVAKDGLSVEDLSLPKSMIARLAKGVLPANTQIHKDALLALHKSTTVFVSYIASNSNEIAQSGGKKTISPQDVMEAMKDCEFEEFLDRLHQELRKYSDIQCNKRNTYRRKVKEEKQAGQAASQLDVGDNSMEGEAAESMNGATNGHAMDDDEDRPVKKFKAGDGTALAPDADGMDDEDMDDALDETEDVDGNLGEDDEDEGDDEEEDEDIDDDDPSENVVDADPDDEVAVGGMRDEALDDPESDSD